MGWKHLTYRAARRVVVVVVGTTLLLLGLVLVFIPGPAVVVWGLALAVFAAEFAWARHWLKRLRTLAEQSANSLGFSLGNAGARDAPAEGDGGAAGKPDDQREDASTSCCSSDRRL